MSDPLRYRYSARTAVSNNASLPALRRNLGTVLAVALLLTIVAPGLAGQESTRRPTAAAGGARATVADGLGCVPYLIEPFKPAGYYDTVWPSEHRDPWRTHAAAGGLPADLHNVPLVSTSVALSGSPNWGYTRLRDQIFVLGGSPFLLDVFTKLIEGSQTNPGVLIAESLLRASVTTPYVARIDPHTMRAKRLDLTEGTSVNYTGGLLVHENGYLYAVARGVLYKIAPDSFTIVASVSLPLAPGPNGQPDLLTAFNGMQATADGDLILKGFPTLTPNATGILLRVAPDTLQVMVELETNVVGAARLTIAETNGTEYLYHPGATTSLRFALTPSAFALDTGWSETYVEPGTGATEGSSDVYMGNGVVFSDNTTPAATAPMQVFAQDAVTDGGLNTRQAFSSDAAGWNFFMMLGDPFRTGLVVVEDQLNGFVAAYRACDGGKSVTKVWETDRYHVSAGAAIAWDRGHLYIDDRECTPGGRCKLWLVVLDLESGRELARVRVRGREPSIGQIFIGTENDVYFPTTDATKARGYLNRVFAAPTPRRPR